MEIGLQCTCARPDVVTASRCECALTSRMDAARQGVRLAMLNDSVVSRRGSLSVRFPLRAKLLLGFGSILVLLAVVAVTAIRGMGEMDDETADITGSRLPALFA